MIKAVILDIDNTLLDFDQSSKMAVRLALEKQNIPFSPQILTQFLLTTEKFWKRIEKGEITRENLYSDRFNQVFESLNIKGDGQETESYYRKFLYQCAIEVDGARDILDYLSAKYIVAVASNAPHEQQVERLEKIGFSQYISYIFTSEKVGADKPSKVFFDACFSQMQGVKKEQTIIIGDSLSADVLGGLNYGIKTMWFNAKNKVNDTQIKPHYIVNSLKEIKKYL